VGGLEFLVLQHQTPAIRVAFGILRDAALAQDVVQSAFVRLPQRIRQFDPARPFAPWFLRIVAHDAVDVARREARTVPLDTGASDNRTWIAGVAAQVPSAEALVEQATTSAALWTLIGELAPEQRAVIVLRYYAGLSTAEIAERLTLPPGTVRWRLHAAHQRLRGLLKRFGWSDSGETGARGAKEVQ
jgi:RNA polymerase sigma-70 factor (ECF subfamily)